LHQKLTVGFGSTGAPKGAEMKILIEKVTGNIAYARPYVE